MGSDHNDVQALLVARAALQDAYERFAHPRSVTIERDDGTQTLHGGPSLWQQLLSAVATGSERGTGSGRSSSRSLLVVAHAVDLKAMIDRQSRAWNTNADVSARIANAVKYARYLSDTTRLHLMTHLIRVWCNCIEDLLSPPKRLHIAGGCPRCGYAQVLQYDMTHAEDVIMPALQVVIGATGTPQVMCFHCRAMWTGEVELRTLATDIGLEPWSG